MMAHHDSPNQLNTQLENDFQLLVGLTKETSSSNKDDINDCASPVSVACSTPRRRSVMRQVSLTRALRTPVKMISKAIHASGHSQKVRSSMTIEDLSGLPTIPHDLTESNSTYNMSTSLSSRSAEEKYPPNTRNTNANLSHGRSEETRVGRRRSSISSVAMRSSSPSPRKTSVSTRLSTSSNEHCLRRTAKSDDTNGMGLHPFLLHPEGECDDPSPKLRRSRTIGSSRPSRSSGRKSKRSSSTTRGGTSTTNTSTADHNSKPRRSRSQSVQDRGHRTTKRSDRSRSTSVAQRSSTRRSSTSTTTSSSPVVVEPTIGMIPGKWQCKCCQCYENEDRFNFCVGCGLRKEQALSGSTKH